MGWRNRALARVVELVYIGDLKSPAARHAGSSPAPGTKTSSHMIKKPKRRLFLVLDRFSEVWLDAMLYFGRN